jgi:hypothetical protein
VLFWALNARNNILVLLVSFVALMVMILVNAVWAKYNTIVSRRKRESYYKRKKEV